MSDFYYYAFPLPVGFLIFICVLCFRLAGRQRRDANCNSQNVVVLRDGRRIISTRRNGRRVIQRIVVIPRQFESPTTPIISGEEGYPDMPNNPPHPYDPPPSYYETSAAQQGQPGTGAAEENGSGAYVRAMDGWMRQDSAAPASTEQPPAYTQEPMVNPSNSVAASNGLLLDVTSLPCASGSGVPGVPGAPGSVQPQSA